MQLLALDFDGVISDSAPESFIVALRTYCELRPASELGSVRDRADGLAAPAIRADPVYRGFVDLMPLGNRAEDFAVVLSILDAGLDAFDQQAYDRIHSDQPPGFLETFHRRFYQVRGELRARHPRRWLDLLGPYPAFVEVLRRRSREVPLALATAKDRDSVIPLLHDYGLAGCIPEQRVLDKEVGVRKTEHLAKLQAQLEVPFSEITFVDDKVNHLEAVAALGVRCALASWGYNGDREHQLAQRRGFMVCSLLDVEAKLFE
jgi:phosphoglycolate phosphatase-like HAD superfamily hydrolase